MGKRKDEETYIVLLLVSLVSKSVFGRGKTRGGVRVGVALCNLCRWGQR